MNIVSGMHEMTYQKNEFYTWQCSKHTHSPRSIRWEIVAKWMNAVVHDSKRDLTVMREIELDSVHCPILVSFLNNAPIIQEHTMQFLVHGANCFVLTPRLHLAVATTVSRDRAARTKWTIFGLLSTFPAHFPSFVSAICQRKAS